MAKIFISYKRVDKDKVFKIKDQLESALGEKCWIDLDGIESDAIFANTIIDAINTCEVFLFMYSKSHKEITDFANDWTIRELNFAQEKRKRIVFINIDRSKLTDWFSLLFGTKQQVDGTSPKALNHLYSDLLRWLPFSTAKAPTPDNHPTNTTKTPEKYFITILKPSDVKLELVKTIMDIMRWGLKESYDFVESIPARIPLFFDRQKAEAVVNILKKTGAEFECHSVTDVLENNKKKAETEFEITITKHGNAKLLLVKIINDTFGLGLANSKKLVDSLPATIPFRFNIKQAGVVVKTLEDAGATVTCRPIGFNHFPTWKPLKY